MASSDFEALVVDFESSVLAAAGEPFTSPAFSALNQAVVAARSRLLGAVVVRDGRIAELEHRLTNPEAP